MPGFHYAMRPLMWQAACGAQDVTTTTELGLIDCAACRAVVARAERLGRAS